MRITTLLKTFVLTISVAATCSMATPLSEHGQLGISGFNVVDKNGNPYILRGMSLFWDTWGFEKFYNSGVVSTLANDWGANLVRAAISGFDASRAKNMIQYAKSSGIYIIIDNHSHCAHKQTSEATSFFSSVAQYVAQNGYNNVIYEIFNEPLYEECSGATDNNYSSGRTGIKWSTIKTYAQTVIAAIRQYDKNGIIIVGTPNYSAGIEAAIKDPITGYSNIAYALHFYASTSGHGAYRYQLLRGKCNDFPVFISEWGTSEADGNGNFNQSMNDTWLSWVETIGVSWANWSISDKGETSSALTSGASSSGGWSDYQLTKSGKYAKNIMKGRNAGGSIASVGLSEAIVDCNMLNGGSTAEFIRTGIGEFGLSIQAENYLDSSNAKTVDDTKATNERSMQPMNSSEVSKLSYAIEGAPTEKGYYRFQAKIAATQSGYLTYSLNGKHVDSLYYEATSGLSDFKLLKGMIVLPKNNSVSLEVSWKGNAAMDFFFIGILSESDSVNYGLLEIDAQGNRKVLIPEDDDDDEDPLLVAMRPGLSAGKSSLELVNRNLNVVGLTSAQVSVFDLQGRVMLKRQIQGSGALDLSGLRAGAYVVRLKGAGVSETKRIQLR